MASRTEVQSWVQFALQQLAAESYLHGIVDGFSNRDGVVERLMYGFNDPTHSYISKLGGAGLTEGSGLDS
jgi:hypothetical protein